MSSKGTTTRRELFFAVLFGVFATLGMSWVIPLVLLHCQLATHRLELTDRQFVAANTAGIDVWTSHLWTSDWYVLYPREGGGPIDRIAVLPRWVAVPPQGDPAIRVDTAGCGWPRRAFASEAWIYAGNTPPSFRWNIVLDEQPHGRTILPLRPIWSGILTDIAFFALLWLAITRLWWWLLRRVRRSRGGCESCGYDMRGRTRDEPCSECGNPHRPATFHPEQSRPPIG